MIGHIFLSLISVAEILSILMQDSEAAAAFKDGMISISSFFIKTCLCIHLHCMYIALVSFDRKPYFISCGERFRR